MCILIRFSAKVYNELYQIVKILNMAHSLLVVLSRYSDLGISQPLIISFYIYCVEALKLPRHDMVYVKA